MYRYIALHIDYCHTIGVKVIKPEMPSPQIKTNSLTLNDVYYVIIRKISTSTTPNRHKAKYIFKNIKNLSEVHIADKYEHVV